MQKAALHSTPHRTGAVNREMTGNDKLLQTILPVVVTQEGTDKMYAFYDNDKSDHHPGSFSND